VLLAGLGSPVLNFSGKHFYYDGVAMVLQPVQLPHPPLWHGLVRANSVAWPVSLRMNVVVNGASRYVRTLTDAYKAEWLKQHGDDALPKMGISRHIVVAESDTAASDLAREGYASWYASNDSLWRVNGARGIYFPATFEEAVALGTVIAGNPETVLRALTTEVAECGANYLIGRFTFGSMPIERVIRSIDLFGAKLRYNHLEITLLPTRLALSSRRSTVYRELVEGQPPNAAPRSWQSAILRRRRSLPCKLR
jgi:alkanesulfonate monooxygenase SsuD/methylene tetrahydromethanopterin reductase-like flavin-dependent oxidoreductase (luciferase family)